MAPVWIIPPIRRAKRLTNSPTVALNTTKMAINLMLRNVMEGAVETHLGYRPKTWKRPTHRQPNQSD